MTKKDYEAIARAIKQSGEHQAVDEGYCEGWQAAVSSVTHRVANVMQADNPRFDRSRFLKACGVQDCM